MSARSWAPLGGFVVLLGLAACSQLLGLDSHGRQCTADGAGQCDPGKVCRDGRCVDGEVPAGEEAEAREPEGSEPAGEGEAAETEPDAVEAEPDAVEAEREAEPDATEAEPDATEAEPDTAEVEPDAAEAEPDAVEAEPDVAEVEPETEPDTPEPEEAPTGPAWRDPATGLYWEVEVGAIFVTFAGAGEYCAALGDGGWRLATINELRSLVRGCAVSDWDLGAGGCTTPDPCCSVSEGCPDCFDPDLCYGCEPNADCYWPPELEGPCPVPQGHRFYYSSTLSGGGSAAQAIDYSTGQILALSVDNHPINYTRCVRDTPP